MCHEVRGMPYPEAEICSVIAKALLDAKSKIILLEPKQPMMFTTLLEIHSYFINTILCNSLITCLEKNL
jgi:hypothetical protein